MSQPEAVIKENNSNGVNNSVNNPNTNDAQQNAQQQANPQEEQPESFSSRVYRMITMFVIFSIVSRIFNTANPNPAGIEGTFGPSIIYGGLEGFH